jgi:hypothetical protein
MNTALVDQIANAVLYEGYILYPYRPSSKKNQRGRFTFGRVYPKTYSEAQHGIDPYMTQTECLARVTNRETALHVTVRFLQPLSPSRDTGWQEAAEREVKLQMPLPADLRHPFQHDFLSGLVEVSTDRIDGSMVKITVRICNLTPVMEVSDAEAILPRTFTSTHAILQIVGGEFISAVEPESADKCKNIGTWPVLVGDGVKGDRDTMLSSPIILSDYPQIAPQSAGDFFDGTEIDEMLTLRVQTMTDEEKREMRNVDARARRLLERVETMPEEQMWKLHGLMRPCDDAPIHAGDRVRIRPKSRADAMDMLLTGKTAVVEAVEQDAEGKFHLALVLDDDPGKDLGMMRQVGHRFFYGLEEVEPV